ncbi:LacI family DNA-binding transcriptional regulator [Gracilibacillus kekensis]|uniref:Transcriptional regulator, LacI family n=1 Tax=Gracilibacillus kekensis TaxID=1027249 RepID=A0A1M7QN18_9BACI|nr:LacI family DNA-binding transcriptional regulator [Gracilibacillus kekensis]SHN32819.1 transcriptional regulator, LacI family [Gracilibacillus kekensis]
MTSLKKIAQQANVSVATVSNVLNNRGRVGVKTKNKILQIAEDLNYSPNRLAKSLKMNKSQTIGVIVEDLSVFNAPEIIDGINSFAEDHGYSILLMNLRMKKKTGMQYPETEICKQEVAPFFRVLLASQVEGVIYIGIHNRDVKGVLPESSIPIVYTYCDTSNPQDLSVNYDDFQASYNATEYLLNNGHKDIGVITGFNDSESTIERLRGFKQALRDHGLNWNDEWQKEGDWTYNSGYSQTKELFNRSRAPKAIFTMNDLMAGGAFKAAVELKLKIPDDIAIIGFDNQEISQYLLPTLTTMNLPLNEIGKQSIDLLIKKINGENIRINKIKLNCTLIRRESV